MTGSAALAKPRPYPFGDPSGTPEPVVLSADGDRVGGFKARCPRTRLELLETLGAGAGAVRSPRPRCSEEHEGMFERFTDQARRVVVLAQEEARMLNHNYIG